MFLQSINALLDVLLNLSIAVELQYLLEVSTYPNSACLTRKQSSPLQESVARIAIERHKNSEKLDSIHRDVTQIRLSMDASLVCIPLCLSIATLEIRERIMRVTDHSTQEGRNDIGSRFKKSHLPEAGTIGGHRCFPQHPAQENGPRFLNLPISILQVFFQPPLSSSSHSASISDSAATRHA